MSKALMRYIDRYGFRRIHLTAEQEADREWLFETSPRIYREVMAEIYTPLQRERE